LGQFDIPVQFAPSSDSACGTEQVWGNMTSLSNWFVDERIDPMDKDELKKMTVAELKEEAKKIPGVKGLSSMKKDELVELLATQPDAAKSADDKKPPKPPKPPKAAKAAKPKAAAEVTDGPLDKSGLKRRIRALKDEKREALSQQDRAKAQECNRRIHRYKRQLRKLVRESAAKQK
jgi:hypothetical protein